MKISPVQTLIRTGLSLYPLFNYSLSKSSLATLSNLATHFGIISGLIRTRFSAIDAASGWILDELEDGNSVPKASHPSEIALKNKNDFLNLIALDMDLYAEKYGQKAIRKNCTIPAWLNTMSENENINFSAVLQEALMEKLHLTNNL